MLSLWRYIVYAQILSMQTDQFLTNEYTHVTHSLSSREYLHPQDISWGPFSQVPPTRKLTLVLMLS